MCNGAFMEMTDSRLPLVICDAGPLIHLDEVSCLDLLADFSDVLVPESVWIEVERHRPIALNHPTLTLQRVSPTTPESPALKALAQVLSLHQGELQALHVALENRPGHLLSDDTAARLAAGHLGITTHGTIGILLRAIRRNQRTRAEILTTLKSLTIRSTLHLKRSLLDAIVFEVENHA